MRVLYLFVKSMQALEVVIQPKCWYFLKVQSAGYRLKKEKQSRIPPLTIKSCLVIKGEGRNGCHMQHSHGPNGVGYDTASHYKPVKN